MSSLSASLCLFSAALCNVAVLDQKLFEQGNQQQVGNQQTLINQATNILGNFGFGGNRQNQNQNKPRAPHQSPCGKKFQYVTNGREWKGIIRIKNIDINEDTQIEVDFALPQGLQRRSYQGKIELVNQGDSVYDDVSNGLPILFETIFVSQTPVPKLVAIYKNKREICSAPLDSSHGLRTFKLKFLLQAPITTFDTENNEEESQQTQSQPIPDVPRPDQQFNQFQDDNAVCGIPVAGQIQSLVVGGLAASRGEWPWLVALYRSASGNLGFICGGSLISSTYTLTAAHCIQDKNREKMQTKNLLLFIGKHNLVEWNEDGYEKKGAKDFHVHPDWAPQDTKYDADIALIEMESAVHYSKYIRPICLWTGSLDINQVVGQTGIVAGWGKNEQGELNTEFPKKVNVPIVSDGQCLRTHEAFVHITSERTFCAGGRMGEGPCQGDSGGALILKVKNTLGRGQYQIRGIVSASLRDGTSCDVNSYAIFTDIAKFLPWIKAQM